MTGIISAQDQDDPATAVAEAGAGLDQAMSDLALADINLASARVVAPVNGIVANFSLRPGDDAIQHGIMGGIPFIPPARPMKTQPQPWHGVVPWPAAVRE